MKTTTYTTTILSATTLFCCFTLANAQDSNPATKSKIQAVSADELASRKASIPQIEERIKDREQQVTVIVDDMKRLSGRIEERIAKIVATLNKMKDSQDSKIRVAHMKQETMEALYRTVENYNRRRAELKEQLRTGKPAVGKDAATKGVEAFDEKIEKRAEQMVALSKSFTEHVDYKKYINNGSGNGNHSGGNSWGWDSTEKNEKWKQNRREVVFTETQRKKMIAALKKSIDNLERRTNTLSLKSKEGAVSAETKKFYLEDIARNENALKTRRDQLYDLTTGDKATTTKSVSSDKAHDTQLLIREVGEDIRRDTNRNTGNYNNLKLQLASLNKMKLNLAARKEWLQNYAAAHGQANDK